LFVPAVGRKRTPLPNGRKVVTRDLDNDNDDDSVAPGGGPRAAAPRSGHDGDDDEEDDDNSAKVDVFGDLDDDNSAKVDVFGDLDDDREGGDGKYCADSTSCEDGGTKRKTYFRTSSCKPSKRIMLTFLNGREMTYTFVRQLFSDIGHVEFVDVKASKGFVDFLTIEEAVAVQKLGSDNLLIEFVHYDVAKNDDVSVHSNDYLPGGNFYGAVVEASGGDGDCGDDDEAAEKKSGVVSVREQKKSDGENKSDQDYCDDDVAGGKKNDDVVVEASGGEKKSDDVAVGKNGEAVVVATSTSKDPLDADDMAVGKNGEAVVVATSTSKDPSDVLLVRPVEGKDFKMTADFVKTAFAQICPSEELKVTLLSKRAALAQFPTVQHAMTAQTTDGHLLRVTFYHGEEVNLVKGGTPKRKSPPRKSSSRKSPQRPRYRLIPRAPTRTSPRRKNNVTADNVTAV
jgi:hypothetical protein